MPVDYFELRFAPAKRKRAGIYRNCKHCGRQFYITPANIKRNEQYCSKACEIAHAPRVIKTCPVCLKEFTVLASQANRYTVCSIECRLKKRQYQKCKRCGKDFLVSERRYARHYCSEECRRPPVIIKCATCGKEIRKQPTDANRQFCSFACYRRSQAETSLERSTREALDVIGLPYIQEARFSRYSVDFYIPLHMVALEVDGDYWHTDKARDARKNAYLKSQGVEVIRITGSELKANNAVTLLSSRLGKYLLPPTQKPKHQR